MGLPSASHPAVAPYRPDMHPSPLPRATAAASALPPPTDRRRRVVLLAAPPLLILSTWLVFGAAVDRFGARLGYFLGFLFYWLVWCVALPVLLLGRRLLAVWGRGRRGSKPALQALALGGPLLLGFGYAFPRAVVGTDWLVIVASFLLALVNAPLEELLWRACYLTVFPRSVALSVLYPTLGFGLWHLAPLSVHPSSSPGAPWSFVLVSTLVGLGWAWVARTRRTVLWSAVAHVLFDFSGLGARFYLQ